LAKAEIFSGSCGFTTVVVATMNGRVCQLHIDSGCEDVKKLATELIEVEPYNEISFHKKMPHTLQLASKYCSHAACPVPTGIIKAVEVAAGLNLPVDVTIRLSK